MPDFLFSLALDGPERELLFEPKTLHVGPSTYVDPNHRCEAAARRARALSGEYSAKARRIDQQFCDTPAGAIGPVEAKLRTFDPVRGIVFGAWGEASPEVDFLLRPGVGERRDRALYEGRGPEARACYGVPLLTG